MLAPPIRVLVVDDSAFMRHSLSRLLGEAEGIEVVGSASNGEEGLAVAKTLRPDVITLDVEMPILDGLGMLRRLMAENPTRVVMLSSLTTEGAHVTLDALDLGALDFVAKPGGSLSVGLSTVGEELVDKVRGAAAMPDSAFLAHRRLAVARAAASGRAAVPAPAAPRAATTVRRVAARKIVVIASSTGGPSALQTLVQGLPADLAAGVVIVQHMPPTFTKSLAGRLDGVCALQVDEAQGGDILAEGLVFVAPGGTHLISASAGRVQLVNLPPGNGVRPAADVTLQAIAPAWQERALCVVLTGMGSDGREGARAVRAHGGTVIAQDEATATIYGMPAAIAEAGLANAILPLPRIASAIAAWAKGEPLPAAAGPARRPGADTGSATTSIPGVFARTQR